MKYHPNASPRRVLIVPLMFSCLCACTDAHAAEPLKVYILAGQSNMQGHAQARTLEDLKDGGAFQQLHQQLVNGDGSFRTVDDVWISSLGSASEVTSGRLTVGYGAEGGGPKIGPELTFGLTIQQHVKQPVLIIKTAWGGKSIHTDFRPPSAGRAVLNDSQKERLKQQGRSVEAAQADRDEKTGIYYRLMMDHVRRVLAEPSSVYPDYNEDAGYEISGFVWFQGWNDMVDGGVYPNRSQPGGYDDYSKVLADFIRDVRRDLSAPGLPFVIGVLGVGGPVADYGPSQQRYVATHQNFRDAMAAPAAFPEFQGNVHVVKTEECWDAELGQLASRWDKIRSTRRQLQKDASVSKQDIEAQIRSLTDELFRPEELTRYQTGTSNAAYHYLGSSRIMACIGRRFAKALTATRTSNPAKN